MNKKEYLKQWRADNKEHIREYNKGRDKEKMKLGLNKKLKKIRTIKYNYTSKGVVVRRKCSRNWKNKNKEKTKQMLRDFEKKNPENSRVRKVMSGDGSKRYIKSIRKDVQAMIIYIKKLEGGLIQTN